MSPRIYPISWNRDDVAAAREDPNRASHQWSLPCLSGSTLFFRVSPSPLQIPPTSRAVLCSARRFLALRSPRRSCPPSPHAQRACGPLASARQLAAALALHAAVEAAVSHCCARSNLVRRRRAGRLASPAPQWQFAEEEEEERQPLRGRRTSRSAFFSPVPPSSHAPALLSRCSCAMEGPNTRHDASRHRAAAAPLRPQSSSRSR